MKALGRPFSLTRSALRALVGSLLFAATGFAAPIIVGHTGNSSTIETYDYATGGPATASFVTTGASTDDRGRGVEVVGNTVYYTAVSGDIHLAPYNNGQGGPDLAVFPNPRPGHGIRDLDFALDANGNGILYALTGYATGPPIVYALSTTNGSVISSVPILSHPDIQADGFTVLPNGHFLINDGDGSATYRGYDPITGAPTGLVFTVPSAVGGTTGVDYNPNDNRLYFRGLFCFACGGNATNELAQTDLSGNLLGHVQIGIGAAMIEDISVITSVPDTCPENTRIINEITICVAPKQRPAGGCGACQPPPAVADVCPGSGANGLCCSNLSEAVFRALPGDTIAVFDPTAEPAVKGANDVGPNVRIAVGAAGFSGPFGGPFNSNQIAGVPKGLRIEECSNAKITAGDPFSPVIDIQPGVGNIIISGLEVSGSPFSEGILVQNGGVPNLRTELKAIRSEGNFVGIRVMGSNNEVNGSISDSNASAGIIVSGNKNLIRSNKAHSNGVDGFLMIGNSNDIRGNEAYTNGGIGFDILGTSNMLRSNQSNRSPQGGAKENDGCEYSFANNTTQDFGGNKKDNLNFVGAISGSPKRYGQGCYE